MGIKVTQKKDFADIDLSIITINKNNEEGLWRTLKSFGRYKNNNKIEFILIDGMSIDDSLVYASEFYLQSEMCSEPDQGIYDAMNKGLARAKGEYVLWINSGDELAENADLLEILRDIRAIQPKPDIIAFRVRSKSHPTSIREVIIDPQVKALPNVMFPHQGIMFKRASVNLHGGYNIEYRLCGDRDLLIRMYKAGNRIIADHRIISIYYLDGLSSRVDLYPENLRIDYQNGLIPNWSFFLKMARYKIGAVRKAWLDRCPRM